MQGGRTLKNQIVDKTAIRSEEIILDYDTISKLEKKHGAPFYLLKGKKLKENYRKIEEAFKSRYKNCIIGYSYKTNYLPYLCKELSKLGAYAEVVSRLEYDLAIKIGEDPKRIIFNGPLKSKEDIFLALKNESILNIDSLYEIDFVKEYARANPMKQVKLGMRLNFDLSEDGISPLQDGHRVSRFGFCVENGDFKKALEDLREMDNIQVCGLHGHFSTRNRSVGTYRKITQELCRIAKEHILDSLEYIDVGGGFYGELPESFNISTPTFDDYAEAICGVMTNEFRQLNKNPNLIIEPGISMVANVFVFITKVIEAKCVRDENFVLVDGSVHNIKPTMHQRNLPMKIVRKTETSKPNQIFHIVGYTCMEKDYLAYELKDIPPERGDYLIFENVGAYTIVFNPPFIKERPGIIAAEVDKFIVVRKQETIKQFFNEEIYCF